MEFTSINRIISKHIRDIGDEINESDIIEWIGEALEFMKVPSLQEEAIAFMEVNNHHANVPKHFQKVLQIAMFEDWQRKVSPRCDEIMKCLKEEKKCDCQKVTTECGEQDDITPDYRVYFDLKWEYDPLDRGHLFKSKWRPVRLAQSTFFRTVVCEDDEFMPHGNVPLYTIVGGIGADQKLRFSFKDGYICLSYYRNAIDEDGYPLIPDDVHVITAIEYYIQWKESERLAWAGREGFQGISQNKYQMWMKYCNQAICSANMPKSLDEWKNLMDNSLHLIPNLNKYGHFFGNYYDFSTHGTRHR